MSTTTTTLTNTTKHWINTVVTPDRKQSLITVTVASFTVVGISFLFSLFLAVSLFDDLVRLASPSRFISLTRNKIDWTGFIDHISHQLTNFAEWEKQKRASWSTAAEEQASHYNEDRFHDMILAVTTYMNEYVHQRKQQTTFDSTK